MLFFVAFNLDLHFTRDGNNNFNTRVNDKRGVFGFHIVNFLFMSSKYSICAVFVCSFNSSQPIRYARCCSNYRDHLSRLKLLMIRHFSLGYKCNRNGNRNGNRLSNTFKGFLGRHTDLVGQHKKNVCKMFADSIPLADSQFYGFVVAQLIQLPYVADAMHESAHAYSFQSTWWSH